MTTDSSDDCLHLSEQEDQENPPESGEMEIIEEVSIGTTEIVHSDDGGISHETEVETIPEENEHDDDDGEDSQPESEGVLTLKETTEESDLASGNRRGNEIRYNSKERVRLILLYAEHPNNPRRIKKLFESEFQKKPPATRTITQLYKKFLETGSVQNNYQKTRIRKSRTDENVERVKQAFQKSPTKSIRTIARELKIPHTTVSRILQELKGKDGGQIRRSRILKIGVKKSEVGKVISGTELVSSVEEQLNVEAANATAATTATGIVSTVMNPAAVDVQQSLSPQQQNSLVTLQTQPFVATIRTTPSIFILETAPSREMLGSLFTCLDFACKKHSNQRRKDPEQTPYINHPIGVASILINEGGITDLDVLQAAILHDTLEDTETTVEELRNQFGEKITSIVIELTDDKTQTKEVRKLMQIDNAPKKSHGAQLVGMADKIYNLRDLTRVLPVGWTEERRLKYVLWAQEVVRHYYEANEALAKILKDIFLHWNVLNYNN